MMQESPTLLEVDDLSVRFTSQGREVYAVNGVDLRLHQGEILGIVGESGSGKSTVLRSLIALHPENTQVTGSIKYHGSELVGASPTKVRSIRGAEISMIFQDPMSYLNPVLTIREQIGETLRRHTQLGRGERHERMVELLTLVGMSAPERRLRQYPHQLSGGMRQRVMIAMALACEPRVLLADEPTTALDVSIQDQILRLLRELGLRLGMSVVIVSHDLGVIARICDRIAVMYGGQVIEDGPVRDVVRQPRHPYTVGLLQSLPGIHTERYLDAIPGTPPRLLELPEGCAFLPRCSAASEGCAAWSSRLLQAGASQRARCVQYESASVHAKVEADA